MNDKRRKLIQTIMLLVLVIIESAITFLTHIGMIKNGETTIYMVNATLAFMIVAQLLWLQEYKHTAFILCHVYFILMCIFLFYAKKLIDVIIFAVNILVLLNTVIVKGKILKEVWSKSDENKAQENQTVDKPKEREKTNEEN